MGLAATKSLFGKQAAQCIHSGVSLTLNCRLYDGLRHVETIEPALCHAIGGVDNLTGDTLGSLTEDDIRVGQLGQN